MYFLAGKIFIYYEEVIIMFNDLFSGKESVRDIMFAIEDKLRNGEFSASIEYFDRLIDIDDTYPLLYERLACVKFWVNREENIQLQKIQVQQFAKMLTLYYKDFISFAARYGIDESIEIVIAIKEYIYGYVIAILENEYKKNSNAALLRDLCNCLIEIKDYKKAIKGFEHLLHANYVDGYILSKLSLLYSYIKNDERSKFYLREVLFYDPLNIEREVFEASDYLKKALLLASKKTNAVAQQDEEELLFWAAVYADVYNIWDKVYIIEKKHVLTIRKMISRFEADCKKKNIRKNVAPRLFLAYTRLISFLFLDAKNNIDEIEFIAKKMEILDISLTREFIESLNI